MRAGKLSQRVELVRPGGMSAYVWAEIHSPGSVKEVGDGLRSGMMAVIRLRGRDVARGAFVRAQGRWFVVEHVKPDGKRNELVLTVEELTGEEGRYLPKTGAPYPVLVSVRRNSPYIGLDGQLMDYRHKLEIPAVQFQRPFQWGDRLEVAGVTYPLRGIAEGGDDGVIVQLMA